MGILIYVPFLTSRGPISRSKMPGFESFPLPISHFPFPISHSLFLVSPLQERSSKYCFCFKSEVGYEKLEFRSEKWEFRGKKWEFRSEKWESGKLISHFSKGIWEVGSGTQMRIPIFKISPSEMIGWSPRSRSLPVNCFSYLLVTDFGHQKT